MNNIKSDEQEKWMPVPVAEYSRAYEVSSMGRVRGRDRIGSSDYFIRHIRGVFLKGRVPGQTHVCLFFIHPINTCQYHLFKIIAVHSSHLLFTSDAGLFTAL